MQHVTSLRLLSSDESEDDPDCSVRSDVLFKLISGDADADQSETVGSSVEAPRLRSHDQAAAKNADPDFSGRSAAGDVNGLADHVRLNAVTCDDGHDRDDPLDSHSTYSVAAHADVMRPITFNDGRVHCCVRVRPSVDPIIERDLTAHATWSLFLCFCFKEFGLPSPPRTLWTVSANNTVMVGSSAKNERSRRYAGGVRLQHGALLPRVVLCYNTAYCCNAAYAAHYCNAARCVATR